MIVTTIAYGVLWWFVGSFGIYISIAAFLGGPAGYFGWFGKVSARVRRKAKNDIKRAASTDKAWDEEALNQYVKTVFSDFQRDWSNFDMPKIKNYLTPEYASHIMLMQAALELRNRRNTVNKTQILDLFPTDVDDLPGNTDDRVTYYINANANDILTENVEGKEVLLFEDNNEFHEYWRLERRENTWLLDGISQLTESKLLLSNVVKEFAVSNGMFYSPDWGWLLLPSRGELFKEGSFGTSDINNHVIGVYHELLVELYTYIPKPRDANANKNHYLVTQIALPKRYDSLMVIAKESFWSKNIFNRTPKGYNKLETEWTDFNKRYEIFATDVEQATVFELLHPVFMEKLFALPFKLNIEVVDDVVYLYTTDMYCGLCHNV